MLGDGGEHEMLVEHEVVIFREDDISLPEQLFSFKLFSNFLSEWLPSHLEESCGQASYVITNLSLPSFHMTP